MGRGKIELNMIENNSRRQVTFTKRLAGLFKKARELSILCKAQVAVLVFSVTGELFQYVSSDIDMNMVLARCEEFSAAREKMPTLTLTLTPTPEQPTDEAMKGLIDEIQRLRLTRLRGMGVHELSEVERQLSDGLVCVKKRKEEILMRQLDESRLLEKQAMMENENLRRQIGMLQTFLPMRIDRVRDEETNTAELGEESSDTNLYLGLLPR